MYLIGWRSWSSTNCCRKILARKSGPSNFEPGCVFLFCVFAYIYPPPSIVILLVSPSQNGVHNCCPPPSKSFLVRHCLIPLYERNNHVVHFIDCYKKSVYHIEKLPTKVGPFEGTLFRESNRDFFYLIHS